MKTLAFTLRPANARRDEALQTASLETAKRDAATFFPGQLCVCDVYEIEADDSNAYNPVSIWERFDGTEPARTVRVNA